MKSHTIVWTPFASACLEQIFIYVAEKAGSTSPAEKLIQRLVERVEQLKTYPKSGVEEELLKAIGQNSRYLVEASYKIIYQQEENKIIITDVFQTSQNPEKITRSKKR